jgi:hypothetical protein
MEMGCTCLVLCVRRLERSFSRKVTHLARESSLVSMAIQQRLDGLYHHGWRNHLLDISREKRQTFDTPSNHSCRWIWPRDASGWQRINAAGYLKDSRNAHMVSLQHRRSGTDLLAALLDL